MTWIEWGFLFVFIVCCGELLEVVRDICEVLLQMKEQQTKLLEVLCNKSMRS